MSYLALMRQLRALARLEPAIASHLRHALRRHLVDPPLRPARLVREDPQLLPAFLGFLERANSTHTRDAHRYPQT
jgi:hypothetical protein